MNPCCKEFLEKSIDGGTCPTCKTVWSIIDNVPHPDASSQNLIIIED
jgi:hypothetical protein